jgi:hypothetical protein
MPRPSTLASGIIPANSGTLPALALDHVVAAEVLLGLQVGPSVTVGTPSLSRTTALSDGSANATVPSISPDSRTVSMKAPWPFITSLPLVLGERVPDLGVHMRDQQELHRVISFTWCGRPDGAACGSVVAVTAVLTSPSR